MVGVNPAVGPVCPGATFGRLLEAGMAWEIGYVEMWGLLDWNDLVSRGVFGKKLYMYR